MARVFGDDVRAIKFFRFEPLEYRGHRMLVARSGWSAQGGFEVYVDEDALAVPLYDDLMAAGEEFGIRPGCPNLIERIEAGLLTYGTDVTRAHTPLEAGLERYCSLDTDIEAIGIEALRRQRDAGVARRVAGFMIDGERVPPNRNGWDATVEGVWVGEVTSAVWSPRLSTNVALGMLDLPYDAVGTVVTVHAPDGDRTATVVEVPFPGASQR